MSHPLSYLQAIVIGLLQGVTELFPVSSLGHSVLVPALIGGSWRDLVTQSSSQQSEASPYLAFIVALHCATAIALLIFYWRTWARVIGGFFSSLGPTIRARRVVTETSAQRLAWLIILATIPVGLTGILLEHTFRTLFAKPVASACFLIVNGLILIGAEVLRRRAANGVGVTATQSATAVASPGGGATTATATADSAATASATTSATATTDGRPTHLGSADNDVPQSGDLSEGEWQRLGGLSWRDAFLVGLSQVLALLSGISRSGVTMAAGLLRGLDHEDAANFAFLLATPVILAAGFLKLPTLAGPAGHGILGPVLAGAVAAGVAAYLSVRFLTRWFTTRTLTPFAVYCLAMGVVSLVVLH